MATLRQKKAVSKIVETGGNVTAAMRAAGYPATTYNNPKVLTESKGFQELMQQYGLTDDLLINALVEDIKAKPKFRFKELELGFKVRGRLSLEGIPPPTAPSITNITQIIINPPHGENTGDKSYPEAIPGMASPE